MTGAASPAPSWLSPLDSPTAYAAIACVRLLDRHLAAYFALSSAVALPGLVWLVRSLVAAQGQEIGGTDISMRFEIAAVASTGLAAIVGWLQVQLLLGRLTEGRLGELRLVALLIGSVRPVHRLMFTEAIVHASIGWVAGTILSLCLATLVVYVEQASLPAFGEVAVAVGIGFAVSFSGVLAPTLTMAVRLARSEGGRAIVRDEGHV